MTPPDFSRYARLAAKSIGAHFALLDSDGYLFRVSRDGCSVLSGAGGVCGYPVNSATAVSIARDKAHAKLVLSAAALPVIQGGLFFAHARRSALRRPGREASDAIRYAASLGYPVFVKPNLGALGNFAEIIPDEATLAAYVSRVAVEFESFLIETIVTGVEHRVLVQDGRPLFHAIKAAPELVGDGHSTLGALLARLNDGLTSTGVSPWAQSALGAHDDAAIPAPGARVPLIGRNNIAADGDIRHLSFSTPQPLAELATSAIAALGLRIGAVDMFDISPEHDLSQLVIVEVNGNPGLHALERTGHRGVAVNLWANMLNELLGDRHVRT